MPRARPIAAAALVLFAAGATTSCGDGPKPVRSVNDVKLDYIARFKNGVAFGKAGRIAARDYDRGTLDLLDVTIEDGDVLMHADRAVLVVDPAADTISLRLISVTAADPAIGELVSLPLRETAPAPLEVDAR